MNSYDVIVLGFGAMGSAATYQLAKKGIKVLGIDQFSPPHKLGSTHGDTRITRQAIGEIYQTIYYYNNQRMHTSIKMTPVSFRNNYDARFLRLTV